MKLDDPSKQRSVPHAVGRGVLARARLQLSQAAYGALSGGLEALGERLSGGNVLGPMGAAAQAHAHRLREVVERDRALVAAKPDDGQQQAGEAELATAATSELGPSRVRAPDAASRAPEPPRVRAPDAASRAPESPRVHTPELAPFVASATAVAPPSPKHCDEPIRTRTMAKLLASQGHRQRALSIYDSLLAEDSSDETLRAEAERLRNAE